MLNGIYNGRWMTFFFDKRFFTPSSLPIQNTTASYVKTISFINYYYEAPPPSHPVPSTDLSLTSVNPSSFFSLNFFHSLSLSLELKQQPLFFLPLSLLSQISCSVSQKNEILRKSDNKGKTKRGGGGQEKVKMFNLIFCPPSPLHPSVLAFII